MGPAFAFWPAFAAVDTVAPAPVSAPSDCYLVQLLMLTFQLLRERCCLAPADKTIKMLDKIVRGFEVSPKEAMELRDAILTAGDLRQPVNLNEQLLKNSKNALDSEVSQSLIQLLSSQKHNKVCGRSWCSVTSG
jgi:glutamine synthetase adenylyltransferase